eukprot:366367-Chlamydomonas_euryale.AAC.24
MEVLQQGRHTIALDHVANVQAVIDDAQRVGGAAGHLQTAHERLHVEACRKDIHELINAVGRACGKLLDLLMQPPQLVGLQLQAAEVEPLHAAVMVGVGKPQDNMLRQEAKDGDAKVDG